MRIAVLVGLVAALWALGPIAPRAETADVTVYAAASLAEAVDEVAAAWKARSGRTAIGSYAASSALARQIEQGAPADVFVSADEAWMDHLAEAGLIRPETRTDLLGNDLVLVAPADSDVRLSIGTSFPIREALGDGRLAVGEVSSVPAGKYARAALESLGVWPEAADRLAEAENVRAALVMVSRGEAPLGIVYRTDAAADPGVRIVGTFPADSHPPITYPVAVIAAAANPGAAADFVAFLRGPEAQAIFEKRGFRVIAASRSQ